MSDKIVFENYLLILKSTVEVYIHGTLESSNDKVRVKLKSNLNEILLNQANTFQIMLNNSWYNIENITNDVISKSLNKLESEN